MKTWMMKRSLSNGLVLVLVFMMLAFLALDLLEVANTNTLTDIANQQQTTIQSWEDLFNKLHPARPGQPT